MRIHPYRTTENVIDGLCLTFVNINRLKAAELAIQQARAYAESIVASVREPLMVLDEKLCVVSANPAFCRTFKTSLRAVAGQLIYQLGGGQWNLPALRKLLEEILPRNTVFENFKVEHDFSGLGLKTLLLNARKLKREPGASEMILLAIEELPAGRATKTKPRRRGKESPA